MYITKITVYLLKISPKPPSIGRRRFPKKYSKKLGFDERRDLLPEFERAAEASPNGSQNA